MTDPTIRNALPPTIFIQPYVGKTSPSDTAILLLILGSFALAVWGLDRHLNKVRPTLEEREKSNDDS